MQSTVNALKHRLIGSAKALELALLGDTITGKQAVEFQLVTKAVATDRFKEEVMDFAQQLAARPTKVIAYIKQLQSASFESTLDDMLAQEIIYQSRAGKTEDHQRAVQAFLEKKPPVFTGR
ncbi:hypothetical protein CEK62_19705 [Alcanivorax sp. N3-2A]|nr:hypothetical protein CEK62_19705 [Alcanivorax sp. N3-2A]